MKFWRWLFNMDRDNPEEGGVPYTITGDGVGHKKACDIIRSKKVKEQLKNLKLNKEK